MQPMPDGEPAHAAAPRSVGQFLPGIEYRVERSKALLKAGGCLCAGQM